MYGEDAFNMRRAVFQSDIDAAKKAKEIDFEALERQAREYAARPAASRVAGGAQPPAPTGAAPPAAAASDLPPGWATAQDASGKTYYWHAQTKAVQWDKPGAPAAAAAPAPAAAAAALPPGVEGANGAVPMA